MVDSAQGQDRSNYQTVGSWKGLTFGLTKVSEGLTFLDSTFSANWANMKAEGVLRGAYHFFHPSLDPVSQAEFFVTAVRARGLEAGDMLMADVEITSGLDGTSRMSPEAAARSHLLTAGADSRVTARPGLPYPWALDGLSASVVGSTAKQFLDRVRALCPHNPVIIYTNRSVGASLASCTGYQLVIAWPESTAPPSVSPWKTWRIWQWSFSGGYDNCDQDAYNGTAEEMRAWIDTFKPRPAPPAPPVKITVPEEDDVPQLNNGEGEFTELTFPAGSSKGIQFFNDSSGQGMAAPQLRIAVHSAASGFSQIAGKTAGEYTLAPAGVTSLAFSADDVNGVSISRYPQGADATVGYTLT